MSFETVTSVLNGIRFRYWLCILVHAAVVLVRAAMVVVLATRSDHRWTFANNRISYYTYVVNFSTTVLITAMLGLSISALRPLAMHYAFTRPRTLTALHDITSAWLGPVPALLRVWPIMDSRPIIPFLIILLYFSAGLVVTATFNSSFAFESYNESVIYNPTLNSVTTAMTRIMDPIYQTVSAVLVASYAYVDALNISLPGLGYGKIYDTLAETAQFESRATVPAIAMNIACGEVPRGNWTFATNPVPNGLNLTVSAILNQRAMSVSGVYTTEDVRQAPEQTQHGAGYKVFQELDPSTAPVSRNLYFLGLSKDPSFFLVDSKNSTGDVFSAIPGILYTKVIGCSISTSNTTVIVDGLNHSVNGTDELPAPDPHPWFNATPLQSRDLPFEDLFGGLFSGHATLNIQRGSGRFHSSLFEEALDATLYQDASLQTLEAALMIATSFSYAVLGGVCGYTNVSAELKAAGWNPKPTFTVATVPVLKARLNMSPPFTIVGFAASLIFFAAALAVIGKSPVIVDEKLVGDPSLLFILSMLRRSSLPAALNNGIDDKLAMNERELRRFGAGMKVVVSTEGQLDVLGMEPTRDEKNGKAVETGRLLEPVV